MISGLGRPWKRMLALVVVTYLAAVFHPVVEAVVHAVTPPGVDGNGMISGSSPMVDWKVFPALEFLDMRVVVVFAPVVLFCVLCSVLDRSDGWRVNGFAGVVTFSAYVIEDLGEDALLMNMALLAVVIAAGLLLWAARDVWDWWWGWW